MQETLDGAASDGTQRPVSPRQGLRPHTEAAGALLVVPILLAAAGIRWEVAVLVMLTSWMNMSGVGGGSEFRSVGGHPTLRIGASADVATLMTFVLLCVPIDTAIFSGRQSPEPPITTCAVSRPHTDSIPHAEGGD